MSIKVGLILLCMVAASVAYGTSYTRLSKPHQSWFDYEISHSKHRSWSGEAHPHGYGGLGDGHGRFRRSPHGGWSQTYFSKPHQGKLEYDVVHDGYGSSYPNGYGGLCDGSDSFRLEGHSKVTGAFPQGQRDLQKARGARLIFRNPTMASLTSNTPTLITAMDHGGGIRDRLLMVAGVKLLSRAGSSISTAITLNTNTTEVGTISDPHGYGGL